MSSESWVDKHRPSSFSDLQGNNAAVKRIRKWAENWEPGDRGQLLVGPPGTGKTSTAFLLADELDVPLNQYNASNMRKSADIAMMASDIQSQSAHGGVSLTLLDEVDGWSTSGRTNRDPMYDVLSNPPCPILLTANDEYQVPDGVKSRTNTEKFKLGKRSRAAKIRDIAEKEGLELDDHAKRKLKERPDLRSAINDMQLMAESDVPIGSDNRQWEEGEFESIPKILTGNRYAGRDVSPPDLLMWLDQGVRQDYEGLEAGVAYDCLARSDVWLGRVWERQEFRYYKYVAELARMVSDVRLTEPYSDYIRNIYPEWFRHSKEDSSSDTPTANVFRKLKGSERLSYRFSGSFTYFKTTILDLLLDLPEEERREIALQNRLEGNELEVLDLDVDEYEEWSTGRDTSVEKYQVQGESVLDF